MSVNTEQTGIFSTEKIKFYLHLIIVVALMFGFRYIPPIAPITPIGMTVLGVFLGLLYGWTMLGIFLPSLLGLIAFGTCGYMTNAEFLSAGFGHDITVMMIFSLIFIGGLVAEFDITDILIQKIFSIKLLYGKPWLFSSSIILANWLVCCFVNPYIVVVFVYTMIFQICKAVDYKPQSIWPSMMIIGCTLGASVSIISFPYKATTLMFMGAYTAATGNTMDWGAYTITMLVLSTLFLLGFVLACRVIFRPDLSKLAQIKSDTFLEEGKKISKQQKYALGLMGATLLCLLLPSFLPKTWFIAQFFSKLGITNVFLVALVIAMCVQLDGKPLINFSSLAGKGMQWNVFLIMPIALPVISALSSQETGITAFIMGILAPILMGKPLLIFLLLLIGISALMTNYFNNMVVIMIFIPITCGYAAVLGFNAEAVCALLIVIGYLAILSPAGSPLTAIMFGNNEWVTAKTGYIYGGIALIVAFIITIVIGLPLSNFLFA